MTVTFAASPYGPNVAFVNTEGALEYIKVAFVISRYDSQVITAGTYPSGSAMLYSASYVFA